jgi:hypothetical protein
VTSWKIDPPGVQQILTDVNTAAGELGKAVTGDKLQGVLDGLLWGGPLTQDVSAAVNAVMNDQSINLTNINNRINAGLVGVSNAVIAYNNGQQDMAAAYQSELVKSAQSGDFTYFVQHQTPGGTP